MTVANILSQEIKTPFTQSLPIIFSPGTWPLAHVYATFNSMTPIMFTKDYLPKLATYHSRPVRVSHGFAPDIVYI